MTNTLTDVQGVPSKTTGTSRVTPSDYDWYGVAVIDEEFRLHLKVEVVGLGQANDRWSQCLTLRVFCHEYIRIKLRKDTTSTKINSIRAMKTGFLMSMSSSNEQTEKCVDKEGLVGGLNDITNCKVVSEIANPKALVRTKVVSQGSDPSTVVIFGSVSPDFNTNYEDHTKPCVWFGCTLQYMVLTNRLKICVQKAGLLSAEFDKRGWELYAKLYLEPSKTKRRQVIEFTKSPVSPVSVPRAYFQNIEEHELDSKNLCVKICRRRGKFKKDILLHQWSVGLDVIESYEPVTVWKKIVWNS